MTEKLPIGCADRYNEIIRRASELRETFTNGNRKATVQALEEMEPRARAGGVVRDDGLRPSDSGGLESVLQEGGMSLKNGHQFHRSRPPPGHENCNWHDPLEKHAPAARGDWGCVLCGSWTTYCLSAQQADEKMGPCPNRRDREQRTGEVDPAAGGQPQ